jgi:hypothetical protein
MSINQKWVFGQNAGLDFSTSPPTATSGFAMATSEGCASISDASGNLLFYTDGVKVWNSSNAPMASNLLGNPSSTQSAIIVPDPANSKGYYVFTADGVSGGDNHLNGIHLDLSTLSWSPTQFSPWPLPNTPGALNGFSPTEKVTAIQHANCIDYWVLTIVQSGDIGVASGPGTFRLFLVDSSGISLFPATPMFPTVPTVGDLGYMKASPSGSRIAISDFENHIVLVYDFNKATGQITFFATVPLPASLPTGQWPLNHPRNPYGVEFSPNEKFLYYTVLGTHGTVPAADGYVFQVDLATPLVSTLVVTHPNSGIPATGYALGALQLSIDGVIYIAKDGENSLGAILLPDLPLLACNPNMTFITLPPGAPGTPTPTCLLGLPNLLSTPCDSGCAGITSEVDEYLAKSCAQKRNVLLPCFGKPAPCPCGSNAAENEKKCRTIDFPKVQPCISVSWGDSKCDCMETDDTEILCITVCNCYSNVTFSDFTIASVQVTTSTGGVVPTLPDGTPSVEVFPRGPICFGDIGPCKEDGSNCVSRQIVLIARGAKGGPYQLQVGGICFDVVLHYDEKACFRLELCPDR